MRAAIAILCLSGCTTLSALSGSTGPIPLTTDPTTGATTSTITVDAAPTTGIPPACRKQLTVTYDSVFGDHDAATIAAHVPSTGEVCK